MIEKYIHNRNSICFYNIRMEIVTFYDHLFHLSYNTQIRYKDFDNDYEYCFVLILIQIKIIHDVFRSHKNFIATQKNIAYHYFHYTKQIPRPFHLI